MEAQSTGASVGTIAIRNGRAESGLTEGKYTSVILTKKMMPTAPAEMRRKNMKPECRSATPNYFFTADEHYFHQNILKYTQRPFTTVEEMNEKLIRRHNEVVGKNDTVIHAGDFALAAKKKVGEIIEQLNGYHVFLQGSHDKWGTNLPFLWERKIGDVYVVVCHYPMLSWPRSHYGSIMLHGHSHGRLTNPPDRVLDIGVDSWDYYPVGLDEIRRWVEA